MELKGCREEIELLDVQILAIGAMHGTKAYESACYKHLNAKVKFEDQHKVLKREYAAAASAHKALQLTLHTLEKEARSDSQTRQGIRMHEYCSKQPPPRAVPGSDESEVPGTTRPTTSAFQTIPFHLLPLVPTRSTTCLLYTSPSPRD